MAEGGGQDNSSPYVPRSQSLDALVLECPICLEQLQHPKSLPCLHSFCQECLGSYITKELSGKMASSSSFSCPVCRKITEPLIQSEDKKRWAEQFPTNNLAVEMIRHLHNTDSLIMTCSSCEKKGNRDVLATFWCEQTKSYFCADCKTSLHDLVHGNCEPENITEWNTSSAIRRKMSTSECGKHKEKLDYFCEDHQILGCNKCIIVDHRKCEVVTSADDFRDKLTCGRIDSLLGELRKCVDAIEILIKDAEEQLESMTESKVTALQSLSDLRTMINGRLDTLQKELTDKLTASFKEEKEILYISKQKCERLMFAMQKTLMSSQDAVLTENTVETITLFQRGQAEVEACKHLVQELDKSSRSTILKHEFDPDILATDTDSSLNMGKVIVDQQKRKLPTRPFGTPLSERQLKMTGRFSIKVPSDHLDCAALGVVLLSGGRVVVGDKENEKVKLFTDNGDFQSEVDMRAQTCDLCRIDDNTVAVMLTTVKTICIITVQDLTLSVLSQIKILNVTDEFIYGITFANNFFVVGTGTSLYRMPKYVSMATKLRSIHSRCQYVTNDHSDGHIFASVYTTKPGDVAVVRLSDITNTDVLKVGVVEGATGVDVDREGNVYVCGTRSHNVIQMSMDGANVRELLTSSDGICLPTAISLLGNQVVITNIGSDLRNMVCMFQLV
ncbi:uncharacterized protein [Argopecten irradians]|uniref:uncharacterized protein n=1 Tax=Argopecten irradians TaxID=31199 RepID=UPI00370FB37D